MFLPLWRQIRRKKTWKGSFFLATKFMSWKKSRKVASGLLIGIRDIILSGFEVIKITGEKEDKVKIARVNCFINRQHYKIFCIYNPPNNKPNLDLIHTVKKIVEICDFNEHSQTWGYSDKMELETFLRNF